MCTFVRLQKLLPHTKVCVMVWGGLSLCRIQLTWSWSFVRSSPKLQDHRWEGERRASSQSRASTSGFPPSLKHICAAEASLQTLCSPVHLNTLSYSSSFTPNKTRQVTQSNIFSRSTKRTCLVGHKLLWAFKHPMESVDLVDANSPMATTFFSHLKTLHF